MRTKLFLGILLASTLILWSSCSNPCGGTKDEFLQKYNKLINESTSAGLSLGDPAWEDYDRDFRKMVKECYGEYEKEMGILEKTEFWWDAANYMKVRYGDTLWEKGGDLWDLVQSQLNILGESNILETLGNQYDKIKNGAEGLWNAIFGGDEEGTTE